MAQAKEKREEELNLFLFFFNSEMPQIRMKSGFYGRAFVSRGCQWPGREREWEEIIFYLASNR